MALRLRRICSTDEFFNTRSDALTTHLIKRGYPHRFIKEEIEKVRHIPRSKALDRDGIRKAREALLISKGKALEPHGINRRDET